MNLEKENILNAWLQDNCNILINASAGCGKTTMLLQLLEVTKERTLFLAFNKSIQEEITQKMESRGLIQGKALTLHSLGLMAVRNFKKQIEIKESKRFDLIKILQKENPTYFKMKWEDKSKLTLLLCDIYDVSRMFLTDNLWEISRYMLIMDKPIEITQKLKILWEKLAKIRDKFDQTNGLLYIDFIDMIYIPVKYNLYIPIEPVYLFIDELQDLSLLQHNLIRNLLKQGHIKRFIGVGDYKQSIYLFGGSLSNSMDKLKEYPNVKEFPLNTCYRCSKNIINKANEVYNVMTYGREEEGFVEEIDEISMIMDNSMIVCRNTAPIIELYFLLLKNGKNCYIKGEDILNSVTKFLTPYKYLTVIEATRKIKQELIEFKKDRTDEGRMKYFILKNNFKIFKILSNNYVHDMFVTIDTIINKFKGLFFEKENAIMLCTIHKSKGLEADIVYILNENLIPSKFAKSTEQLIQEQNLKYVARTRAKNRLYFINLSSYLGEEEDDEF
jgi:superfamily I DNA/RNA helicase